MKSRKIFGLIFILCVLALSCIVLPFQYTSQVVYAESIAETTPDPDPEPTPDPNEQEIIDRFESGYRITTTDISDTALYAKLIKIIRKYIADNYDNYNYQGDTLYSNMFVDITEIVILDDENISSIKGIENLKLHKLEKLVITNNKISTIDKEIFIDENKPTMPELKRVDFANNRITSCDLTPLTKLEYVNLSTNKLTSIDLSNVVSSNIEINVANNNISAMADIKLPTRTQSTKLNIISNNITDIAEEYFSSNKYTLSVGVQGLKISSDESVINLTTTSGLRINRIGIDNVDVQVYRKGEIEDTLVATILNEEITGSYIDYKLGVGNYYINYVIDGLDIYDVYDSNFSYFTRDMFNIVPAKATHLYEYKGQDYEKLDKVTGAVKVKLFAEEGAEIEYKLDGNDWVKGNEVLCDNGGNHTIVTRVVIDGYVSEESTIIVKTSLNPVIPDVIMFLLILFFAIALFFVGIPLVSKKFFKKN